MSEEPLYLLVGLGNPGRAYAKTRHNVGFRVLEALAEQRGWTFRKSSFLRGGLAQGSIGGKKVFLLLPETYMNSSGESVRASLLYYGIDPSLVCVVCDDIYLPLGRLRMRPSGGSGGHNGLKSVESHLGTQAYTRLRVGVGDRQRGDLADHVLSPFCKEEEELLPEVLKKACLALECWVEQGWEKAVQLANAG